MTHRRWRKFQVRLREKRKFNFVDVKSFLSDFRGSKSDEIRRDCVGDAITVIALVNSESVEAYESL